MEGRGNSRDCAREEGSPESREPAEVRERVMDVITAQDSAGEEGTLQIKGECLPFQIFPDPVEVAVEGRNLTADLGCKWLKERLPSIVVEPTDVCEVESGELRWPPQGLGSFEEEEDEDEDLFLDQCIPPANIADWEEEEEEEEEAHSSLTDFQMKDELKEESPACCLLQDD
ncbi:protein LBH-like isoform X1 [Acipenser ruthenus]|uniref:protein LBH-like isoform X1 n=1 Tax=Acipenser ruthenus TaxID=7906 RepID=UPI002742056B|nr:protein LBH-like isoform X1 [Acipenser ruthenus]